MRPRTILDLTPQPLERVDSDVAVAGFFTDERPLRGGAARADWRLCGGLSKRIAKGDLSGRSGEALLIASGRALRAPRLLVLGLGDRQDFDATRFREETCLAVRRCVGLRCPVIALAPMGIAPDDVPRHAAALLSGIRAASEELAGGPEATIERAHEAREETLWIHLCLRRSEISGVQRALQEACREADAAEIEIRAPEAERGAAMDSSRAGAPMRRQG